MRSMQYELCKLKPSRHLSEYRGEPKMAGRRTFRIHTGLNNVNIDTKAGSVPTSQETHHVCATERKRVHAVRGVAAVY
jgi:hypothetical protein